MLQALTTLQATASWAGVKERRIQRVRNGLLDVSKHAHWLRLRLLMANNHSSEAVLNALQAVDAGAVAAQRVRLLECCHVEVLVEGNIARERSDDMCRCADACSHWNAAFRHGVLRTASMCVMTQRRAGSVCAGTCVVSLPRWSLASTKQGCCDAGAYAACSKANDWRQVHERLRAASCCLQACRTHCRGQL